MARPILAVPTEARTAFQQVEPTERRPQSKASAIPGKDRFLAGVRKNMETVSTYVVRFLPKLAEY
jgi:hypothetical protein